MSVINRMLKDLDKRQSHQGGEDLPVPQVQFHQPATGRLPWILFALALSVLLVGGAFAWYKLSMQQQEHRQLFQNISVDQSEKARVVEQLALVHAESTENGATEKAPENRPKVLENTVEKEANPAKTKNVAETAAETQDRQLSESAQVNTPPVTHAQVANAQAANAQVTSAQAEQGISPAVAASQPDSKASKPAGMMAIKEVILSPQALAEKRFAAGQAAQNEGNMTQAESDFSEALRLNSQLHQARRHLAALYYGQGMMTQAESVLQQGMTLFPEEYEYSLLLARVYDAVEMKDEALAVLASIPDESELAKQKWSMQSHLAQQQGAFPLAEQSYRQLARIEPDDAKWWMGLAYALDSQHQFSTAKQAYRQALVLDGLSTQALEFIERRLAQLGEIQ
ncbi:tetratricopeptide repeat protein [Shewanella sp. AS1]|uniref:tetratricopeptide repeat protein n=1 Tax=Shewanella sp. AS1 TaxID=2907626 RepID=UPI001F468B6F|nr:tetratricopeptide repeat protein [Shewanella sp. AS1]MCE9679784.1 tetratricopeptide repeat protein [Shewanella sp. AS1]